MNIVRAQLELALGGLAFCEKQVMQVLTSVEDSDTVVRTSEDDRHRHLMMVDEYSNLGVTELRPLPPPEEEKKRVFVPEKVASG